MSTRLVLFLPTNVIEENLKSPIVAFGQEKKVIKKRVLGSRQRPTSKVRAACSFSTPSIPATTCMNGTSTSSCTNPPTNAPPPPAANNQESPTVPCCTEAAASRPLSKVDDAENKNRKIAPSEESAHAVAVPPSVESCPSSSRTISSHCAPPHAGEEYPQVASTTDPHSATMAPAPNEDKDTATREVKIELLYDSGGTHVLRDKSAIPDFASCKPNYTKGKRRQGRNLREWDLPPAPKKKKIFTTPPPVERSVVASEDTQRLGAFLYDDDSDL